MGASQLAALDGRKTVARRSLERSAPGALLPQTRSCSLFTV